MNADRVQGRHLNEVKVSRADTLLEEERSQRHVGIRLGVSQAVIWMLWQHYLMTGRLTRYLDMDCLPQSHDLSSYITSCLSLLEKWSWLYQFRNIDLLNCGILDIGPFASHLLLISELKLQEFNMVPQGFIKDEWPADLKYFIRNSHLLKLVIPKLDVLPTPIDQRMYLGMKEKKREEVIKMSYMVSQTCIKHGIKRVIDIGSGLGHIDRILHHTYGLKVLGIEMDEKKVSRARSIDGSIDYISKKVSEETLPELVSVIKSWHNGDEVCLIALHSCGDLSLYVGNLFEALPFAKFQIIVPCCYHRSLLLPLMRNLKSSGLFNTNLLRIASDTNAQRWEQMSSEQHKAHAMSVLARNIIQLLSATDKREIKKNFRHFLRITTLNDWQAYLESCLKRTSISSIYEDKIRSQWHSQEWRINQMESYTCLQVCLQGIAEGVIIVDILKYLTSNENVTVRLFKIFNDVSSPRSVAILVTRT